MNMINREQIRVLLWAPRGAGLHYDGMGLNAFRMYSTAPQGLFDVELAHGLSGHTSLCSYSKQHLISDYSGGWSSTYRFLNKAKRWLSANAHRFDVMHCLNIFEVDIRPALWA